MSYLSFKISSSANTGFTDPHSKVGVIVTYWAGPKGEDAFYGPLAAVSVTAPTILDCMLYFHYEVFPHAFVLCLRNPSRQHKQLYDIKILGCYR